MDTISPVIINSKAAQKDMNNIAVQHADILNGIRDQATKVANYNSQRENEKQFKEQTEANNKIQNDKAKMDADTKRIEAENKQKELEIKQQALSL